MQDTLVEMSYFSMEHTSLLYTNQNTIGFLKFDGGVGSVMCRAEHDVVFVAAVADGLSAGHTFGLSADGWIFVYKTSNLIQKADATECYLEAKF